MPDTPRRRRAPVVHPNAVYTVPQLNRLLGLREETVRRERKLGRLRVAQRAGRLYILGKWVIEWLEAGEAVSRREAA